MECCLLCLELNKEFVDSIKVDSKQWLEFNIKTLIEKHLWIMETLLPSSWLCSSCWQALNDFHKFYMRIEEAHMDFGKLMDGNSKIQEDTGDLLANISLNESYLEPDILLNDLLLDDHKPHIKEEVHDDSLDGEDIPLIQISNRKRQNKDLANDLEISNKDPLNNSKKSRKKSTRKIKKKEQSPQECPKKKEESSQENPPEDSVFDNGETEKFKIKQDPDNEKMPDSYVNASNSSDSEDFDARNDLDYEPEKESEPLKEKDSEQCKKPKRKYKRRKKESNDSNSDNDSEEDAKMKSERPWKEKNEFLAKNFKMTCVLCQIPMETFTALVKHFKKEHTERGYAVCCNKKFHHRVLLIEHVERHLDPTDFKCKECGKVLSSRLSLKTHQLLHLSEEDKKFACAECGKTYPEQNKLNVHINQVHLKKYVKMCDICGKNMRCGESFQRHMLEHEGKPLPSISCDVCGLLLSSKHGLGRHKAMQHPVNGKTEHTCTICFKVSPNSYALRKHINSTHKATERHKCTMCGRGFKRPLALREHMATHTGIALYNCPWCPKTFNASGGLHAHRKSQHPAEWEESRQQKKMERYKTTGVKEINDTNTSNFKLDLSEFVNDTDLN